MAKVWLVTSGSYSYYRVRGVFDDQRKAEAFESAILDKAKGLEEYELNATPRWYERGLTEFWIWFKQDGNVHSIDAEQPDDKDAEPEEPTEVQDYVDLPYACVVGPIYARDKETAVKIASEKRREHIAMQGVTQPLQP